MPVVIEGSKPEILGVALGRNWPEFSGGLPTPRAKNPEGVWENEGGNLSSLTKPHSHDRWSNTVV